MTQKHKHVAKQRIRVAKVRKQSRGVPLLLKLFFSTPSDSATSVQLAAGRHNAWKPSYLAEKPGYWSGLQDVLNIYGYFKPRYRFYNPHLADSRALYEDWAAVGADLERCLRRFEKAEGLSQQDRLFDPAALDKGA